MNPDLNKKLQETKKRLEEEKLKDILKNRAKKRKEIPKTQSFTSPNNPIPDLSSGRFLEKPFQRNPFSRTSNQNPLSQKVIYKPILKAKTENPVKLPKPPQWKPEDKKTEIQFTIGIDFGTSSTKICARKTIGPKHSGGPEPIYPISLDQNPSNWLCPSSVFLKDEKIYFGWEAEKRARESEQTPLRHLKVCLACEKEPTFEFGLYKCQAKRNEENIGKPCGGEFFGTDSQNRDICLKASELVTLYLGWAIHLSRIELGKILIGNKRLKDSMDLYCTYNLGVPVDQLDEKSSLVKTYLEISYKAWRVSEGICQGILLKTAKSWMEAVAQESPPLPEMSPVYLFPETAATLQSFLLRGKEQLPPGLYGIVDIGAWTSDISIFRPSEPSINQGVNTVSFMNAKTVRIACSAIDNRATDGMKEFWELRNEEIQRLGEWTNEQREGKTFGEESVTSFRHSDPPPICILEFAKHLVAEKIKRAFVGIIKTSHNLWIERYGQTFKDLKLLIVGGGSGDEILSNVLKKYKLVHEILTPNFPSDLELGQKNIQSGALTEKKFPKNLYRRLAVAHGLAFPAGLWPEILSPSQIKPMTPPLQKPFQNSEDLGYSEK